jgi:hypothetical protein
MFPIVNVMVNRIETHTSLEAFFGTLLREALRTERVELETASFTYLLNLVGDFSNPEALASGRGEAGTPGLVWLYQEAREAPPSHRFEAYRRLGDVALMVAGFFGPHIQRSRSVVGIDYYVDMGRTAYEAAGNYAARSGFSQMLGDISAKFEPLVEVLTRMAEQTTLPVAHDMAALYARILRNPDSHRLSVSFKAQGAFPVFVDRGVAA